MAAKRAIPASDVSKINMWLNIAALIAPILIIVVGGLYTVGNFTATIKGQIADQSKDIDLKLQPLASKVDAISIKVDSAARDAQSKADVVTAKVEANTTLTQAKADALAARVDGNIVEQQTFRTNVQNLFSKVFDSQQKLADQIQQEKVDRLSEQVKKK